MEKPAHYLPAHINVEADVSPIKTFIQDTNCIIMPRHGFTVLGRTVSEAYHRTNELAAEAKRNTLVAMMTAGRNVTPDSLSLDEVAWGFEHGGSILDPPLMRPRPTHTPALPERPAPTRRKTGPDHA